MGQNIAYSHHPCYISKAFLRTKKVIYTKASGSWVLGEYSFKDFAKVDFSRTKAGQSLIKQGFVLVQIGPIMASYNKS